ncbi:ATP-dependent DNA helicase RecG [Carboxydocella sp. ULO1]|nr:ATP-dependent DNA helicase RecG [Carboxydocella sp. ULO1]
MGRGEYQSYCFLISDTQSAEGRARLRIMEQTNDGFVLAEEDLKLRGPGEFFGTRQSGLPELKVADLVKDLPLLEGARQLAFRIVEEDPKLARPEHRLLKEELKATFADGLDLAQIG